MGKNSGFGRKKEPEVYNTVAAGLKKLYNTKLKPLEDAYKFHDFHSPPLDEADFDAKPMILLVGQYSTGKTTFIKYLLEQEFPGMRIGPEPTTDCFIIITKGDQDQATGNVNEGIIPGNALVVDRTKPFRALSSFGNNFLSRLQCSQMNNPVLDSISIIDSPGILSGEKQRVNRGYDFSKVLTWFAERVDRIILLFDAHKLDISDEFHEALNAVKGYDDKIRVVLNKSDQVNTQQLMRVYGALMWSLGKVISTPEVVRVYIGSFWDQPFLHSENRGLFEAESADLFEDLQSLPRNAALRKLNDLIKRARLAKVHAFIVAHLHDNMPTMFGKEKTKAKLIANLQQTYTELSKAHGISPGDFPDVRKMQEMLKDTDFSKFQSLRESYLKKVDVMLGKEIPELMKLIQKEEAQAVAKQKTEAPIKGGALGQLIDNPFGAGYGQGALEGCDEDEWVVSRDKPKYDRIFADLQPVNGKVSGSSAKNEMVKSKLPNSVLGKIWKLSDNDHDGYLDDEEFALAMHLIKIKLENHELPTVLPSHLIPPSQRTGGF